MMAASRKNPGPGNSGKGTRKAPARGRGGEPADGTGSQRAHNERGTEDARSGPGMQGRNPSGEPDVILDVPKVHVDEIYFDLERLEAQLSLRAQVANLVQIAAGVHAHLGKVELDIKDVHAEALFKVRLENLYDILDRTFTTLDRNPEVLQGLLNTANNAVDDVGQIAQQAIGPGGAIGHAVDKVGQVGEQALGPGGAATQAAGQVGGAAQQAVGPGGAASEAAEGAGDAAQQAVQPGGAVSQTADAAGQAAQGVGNAAGQAGQGIGQGAGQAAQATQEAAQNAQGGAQGADGAGPPGGKKKGAAKRPPSAADKRGTKLGSAAARSVKRAASAVSPRKRSSPG
jgi:methyl-accepting chemotaxis protein